MREAIVVTEDARRTMRRVDLGYEPPATSPSAGVSMAFIGVALGGTSVFWAAVAVGFDVFASPAIVPVPVQAWMLSAGVVPSAIVGLAIGARHAGTNLGRLAIGLSLPALMASLLLLSLAWLGRW